MQTLQMIIMLYETTDYAAGHQRSQWLCAGDLDINNKCCFAACARHRQDPEKLVVYAKGVANVPRVIIIGHVYIRQKWYITICFRVDMCTYINTYIYICIYMCKECCNGFAL